MRVKNPAEFGASAAKREKGRGGNSHLDVRKIAEEEGRDNEVGSILLLWLSIWVDNLDTWLLQ